MGFFLLLISAWKVSLQIFWACTVFFLWIIAGLLIFLQTNVMGKHSSKKRYVMPLSTRRSKSPYPKWLIGEGGEDKEAYFGDPCLSQKDIYWKYWSPGYIFWCVRMWGCWWFVCSHPWRGAWVDRNIYFWLQKSVLRGGQYGNQPPNRVFLSSQNVSISMSVP